MNFEDHFSEQAQDYVRYRPQYPPELFAYLASIAPGRQLAWDCGTGNGQAALSLAEHFDGVVATDASADQITHATPHPRISYRVERAEDIDLDANSLDLVTVAIAAHWFDFDAFYQAVRRVLKPGGVIAVWTYHLPAIEPAIDRLLTRYYQEVLAGYWPDRFRYVDARYRTLPFPFTEVSPPEFEMLTDWTLPQVAGFLSSWSATRQYVEAHKQHPLEAIWQEFTGLWGDPERTKTLHWPLNIRVGRAE